MKRIVVIFLIVSIAIISYPQMFYKNSGKSKSFGTVSNGKLENAYKLPYNGDNYKFFSLFDYLILGRCYIHSSVYNTLLDTYKELDSIFPNYKFRIMECSKKDGGELFPHKTHQNGTSVDFLTPLKKNSEEISYLDNFGIFRYLMDFDENGRWETNNKVVIDFEKVAKHILLLEKNARKNGYKIKKVILETNLKDELFASGYGIELNKSKIYFVKSLPENINKLHDDHYHVDFVKL